MRHSLKMKCKTKSENYYDHFFSETKTVVQVDVIDADDRNPGRN